MPLNLANLIGGAFPQLENVQPLAQPIWPDGAGGLFNDADWAEAVNIYSPNQLSIGHKRSHTTLMGYIPWNKIRGAMMYFCGLAWVDENNFLRRSIPGRHPFFPNLYASEIMEVKSVKFVAKQARPYVGSVPYASYAMALVTVAYSQPPYDILPDANLGIPGIGMAAYRGLELFRFCRWTPAPYLDQWSYPGGTFSFVDSRGTFNGKAIQGNLNLIRAQKSTMYLDWYDVPLNFVANPAGLMTKFMDAQGKVNSETWMGCDPGTWLFDKAEPLNSEVYTDPIATVALTALARRVDLRLTFKYFNPTPADATTRRGWYLVPTWTGEYLSYDFAQNPGVTLPDSYDFRKLFTHVTADP